MQDDRTDVVRRRIGCRQTTYRMSQDDNLILQDDGSDVARTDIVILDVVRSDVVRSDVVRSDVVRSDVVRSDVVRLVSVRLDFVRLDPVRSDVVRSDVVRSDVVSSDVLRRRIGSCPATNRMPQDDGSGAARPWIASRKMRDPMS